MVALPRAVDDLIAAATSGVESRALKPTVEKVLDAFDSAAESTRNSAVRTIGRALGKVDGRADQILSLALGALVESGASPDVAWPSATSGLTDLLLRATAFANAAVKQSGKDHLDAAIEAIGAVVAKKKPREAEAWNALPARCLAAVACLARSKKVRANARRDQRLAEACWPLSDAVSEVGYLLQALRIVDDETLLVLAPSSGRGWRVDIDAMPSNAELYVLLADALVGDPKKGMLPGKRPDPKAVAAIREGSQPSKRASSVVVPFHLVAWTATADDGSLPSADAISSDHYVWMEGIPADIPPLGREHIVLLQDPTFTRPVPVAPPFESLRPTLRISADLSREEVARKMRALGKAALRLRPAASAKPRRGKTTKTATKTKTKTKGGERAAKKQATAPKSPVTKTKRR